MARFDRLTVFNIMLDAGLVPIFCHADLAVAKEIVSACVEGGACVVEFTSRNSSAVESCQANRAA